MTEEMALRWPLLPKVGWGPLRFGMKRKDAISAIEKHGSKVDPDDLEDPDPTYVEIVEPWGVLHFDEQHDSLERIEVFEEQICIGEECYSDPTLDVALTALGARSFNDARWTHKTLKPPLPEDADLQLLRGGILWIQSLGVGLELQNGRVDSYRLRRPHVPVDGDLGPLTPQQLELATSPDVLDPKDNLPENKSGSRRILRMVLLSMVVLIAVELYQGYLAATRWREAQPAMGEVVRLLPEGSESPQHYVVAFSPDDEIKYEIEIAVGDSPRTLQPGDEIKLVYQPDSPHQATTEYAASRSGFIERVPMIVAIGVFYCALAAFLAFILR